MKSDTIIKLLSSQCKEDIILGIEYLSMDSLKDIENIFRKIIGFERDIYKNWYWFKTDIEKDGYIKIRSRTLLVDSDSMLLVKDSLTDVKAWGWEKWD